MILQSLHALYDRLADDETYDVAEPGFSPQNVSFCVVLFPDRTFAFHDARQAGRPVRMTVPGDGKRSGSKPVPFFTWDNGLYILGLPPKGRPQSWADQRFKAFRDKHLALRTQISSPFFQRACVFLENWKPEDATNHPILQEISTHYGVFQLAEGSRYLHQDEAVLQWWKNNVAPDVEPDGQCLITGQAAKIARLHPVIKGITPPKGKQQQDGPLVSIDKGKTAFASYLKEQSFNSPVGEDAAFRYGAALNELLKGPQSSKHRIRIGDATCVFWTDRKTILEDIFAAIAGSGDHAVEETQDQQLRAKIHAFLKALQQGRETYGELAADPDVTRFYLLGLSPNAARLSVRFFYQSSIRELLDHLRKHKRDLEIIREFEQPVGKRRADSEFPAYWEFLRETVRRGDDPAPLLGGALMRAILEGTRYPESLLGSVVQRVRTVEKDRKTDKVIPPVNYLRAAAIKAVLTRNHQLTITTMLDPQNTRPAYLLGRLFAVLEKIQEEGHREQTGGTLEKTIRDTYFSAACATPASVFPRIEQLSTHHRRHLNPGRKVQFDQLIASIKWPQSPASGTAKSHNLEDQGLFILGYYHQRKDLFTRKEKPLETAAA
jgi:CRISPR-associated protein Csd1